MNRVVVNIDLDNVVYDFNKAMHDYAEFILNRELPQSTNWATWDDWGIPRGAFDFIFRRGVEEGFIWRTGRVIPGAIEGLWALSDAEYHIRLVTTRLTNKWAHDVAAIHTVEWLKENAIPYRSLALIGGGDSKVLYQALALVDDNEDNLMEWAITHGNAIAFDQPWNRELVDDNVLGIVGATNWAEVVEHIEGITL